MASVGPDSRRAVASRVPPLSPADRADRRPDRASSSSWRGDRRQREDRQPVRAARRHHRQRRLNLTTGRSGLILDLVIEPGNPADSERFLPMLKRHIAFYGEPPRQAAADGGFASRHNLGQAKALGVRDLAFHKKAGLRIKDMVKSNWVYRKLRNFRAGIEADISCLKRAYGLARCIWRGLDHFRAYVWSSVVAYNLALFARLKPT